MKYTLVILLFCTHSLYSMLADMELRRIKKFDIETPDDSYELNNSNDEEKINHEVELDCSICLDDINLSHAQDYTTHCGHVFCCGCLDEWIAQKKECPLCRRKLTSENEPGFVVETMPEMVVDSTMGMCLPIGMYFKLLYFRAVHASYYLSSRR